MIYGPRKKKNSHQHPLVLLRFSSFTCLSVCANYREYFGNKFWFSFAQHPHGGRLGDAEHVEIHGIESVIHETFGEQEEAGGGWIKRAGGSWNCLTFSKVSQGQLCRLHDLFLSVSLNFFTTLSLACEFPIMKYPVTLSHHLWELKTPRRELIKKCLRVNGNYKSIIVN